MGLAQRIITRFFQLDDVDKASFADGDVPQYSTSTGKLAGVPLPSGGPPAWVTYVPPSSGTATMPETATAVTVPGLTDNLTLTLRDCFNMPSATEIWIKCGALNAFALTLVGANVNAPGQNFFEAPLIPRYGLRSDYCSLHLIGDPATGLWHITTAYQVDLAQILGVGGLAVGLAYPKRGVPGSLLRGPIGSVLQCQIVGTAPHTDVFPVWGPAAPTYEQQPYQPLASGADTMPEDVAYVSLRNLTGDLTLRLRDAYNLNLSLVILIKCGLMNGHTLTLTTQDGNLIEGASTFPITADHAAYQFIGSTNNGTWTVIGRYLP